MIKSDYQRAESLLRGVEGNHSKYGAWETASQLASLDIVPFYNQIVVGLRSSDPFSRECFLEVLAKNQDPDVVRELGSIFQYGSSDKTARVESLSRLRSRSNLPPEFYQGIDQVARKSTRRELSDPLELVDAIPNIIFPGENADYARTIIRRLHQDPHFFKSVTDEDVKLIHALFYVDHDNPKNQEYRPIRMWDFDPSGSPVEPYGQPFVGPSSIPFVMDSLLEKMRTHEEQETHPLQFIGESFFHHNIIHPFYDCNGRTNFLLMDLFLLDSGLPYIKMVDEDLPEYYRTLNLSEPTQFIQFLGGLIKRD
jgi:hypothetical protein